MKNAKFELFGHMQRQFHRDHPWGQQLGVWRLSPGGLLIRYWFRPEIMADDYLSEHEFVGFILNRRRVFVSWKHPRQFYSDAIQDQSLKVAGDAPEDDWLHDGRAAVYKRVGKSRKKIVPHYPLASPRDRFGCRYFHKLKDIEKRLWAKGIELDVSPSWKRERRKHGDEITLVAPMEVRNETELALVAKLARRLILGETTLEAEFPGYRYGKADWLSEQHPYPF